MNFVRSKSLSLKYQSFTSSDFNDIGISKSEFVTETCSSFSEFLVLFFFHLNFEISITLQALCASGQVKTLFYF